MAHDFRFAIVAAVDLVFFGLVGGNLRTNQPLPLWPTRAVGAANIEPTLVMSTAGSYIGVDGTPSFLARLPLERVAWEGTASSDAMAAGHHLLGGQHRHSFGYIIDNDDLRLQC